MRLCVYLQSNHMLILSVKVDQGLPGQQSHVQVEEQVALLTLGGSWPHSVEVHLPLDILLAYA